MSIRMKLSTKMNRRILATILGIAFCVTYLTGTTAMVGGLHDTTENLASSFDQGPLLVYSEEDFARSQIDGNLLPVENTTFVAFTFANVTYMDDNGHSAENIYAVSIYDPTNSLGLNMTNESTNKEVWMGPLLMERLGQQGFNIVRNMTYRLFNDTARATITLDNIYSPGSIFPDDWLIIPRTTMNEIRPEIAGNFSFLMILDSQIPPEELQCCNGDTTFRATSGVVGFFEKGIYQVEQDLWGIILMSGLMTAMLVYCIIAIETEYYAPTIKILRGMGANRSFVIQIFIFKALFITLAGGILGVALGICAAFAISSISSLLDVVTFITPVADFNSVIIPVIIAIISGLVGGFWPAIKASRMFVTNRRAA